MLGSDDRGLLLAGLDGSNPLGFLAAVGTLRILADASAGVSMGWRRHSSSWNPCIAGVGDDHQELCATVLDSLTRASTTVFDIGKESKDGKASNKFPFEHARFAQALREKRCHASCSDRRDVDFLAGFGTELYPDKRTDEFQGTNFRMVRSGDSNRQGMLFYAKALRKRIEPTHVERTLFRIWDYQDESSHSLRWDPIEDQRYALRWRDPSKSSLADGPGTMVAANALAVEALRCFPTLPTGTRTRTTGFELTKRQQRFVWPIWATMLRIETVVSLLSLRQLLDTAPCNSSLRARGILEVYRSQRVRQNQYYFNFGPAQPAT